MGSLKSGSPARLRGLPVHVLPWGQEALRKIITTLAVKNEEIQSFIYSLKQMLLNVEVRKSPPRREGGAAKRANLLMSMGLVGLAATARPVSLSEHRL